MVKKTAKPSVKLPAKDLHAAREAQNYENPVPSREYLLDLLRNSNGPLDADEICQLLELDSSDQVDAIHRRLRAMERDGQVARNRRGGYGTLEELSLVKGRVIGHPEGFGFVTSPERRGDDIYLSSRQMKRVFDGDTVLVRLAGYDRRGRAEGVIVDVVERGVQQIVGRFFAESGIYFVRPDNPRISQDIMVAPSAIGSAEPGQIVVVDIIAPPSRNQLPTGAVIEILGNPLDPGIEIEIAIRNFQIPHQWNRELEAQTAAIPDHVEEADKVERVDLRDLPLVTIDGEDARDFDDAVYCEPKKRGGWRLIVAIADVSHYVLPNSPLDVEAYERGNSVYFPNHVVPMLPEKLSNGLCSLNPHQDRLCMVCEMQVGKDGEIGKFQFYEGVMHSHARLTYTQVARVIAERHAEQEEGEEATSSRHQFANVLPQIDALHDLYQVLHARRNDRGAIDFDSQETRILFDAQRKISQIIPVARTDAHRLIEECMLAANVCAAEFLSKSKLPALYRVHLGPSEEKLTALREFLGELGLALSGGDDPQPEDYQRLLRSVANRTDAAVIQTVLLRSMRQAMYQRDNDGHFGLAFDAYTHFTSPIRRYADLMVHRAIRGLLRSKRKVAHLLKLSSKQYVDLAVSYPYGDGPIDQIGEHISITERRADEATRDVSNWLKCEYLVEHVGDEFDGVVSAVTGFGLFVMLNDLYVEGLIHVTGLPKDYYYHEQAQHRMVGERSGRVFRLGDTLRVKVVRVDLDERKVDFELVDSGEPMPAGKAKPHKPRNEQGRSKRGGGRGGDTKKAGKPAKKRSPKSGARGKSGESPKSAKKRAPRRAK